MDKFNPFSKTLEDYKLTGLNYVNSNKNLFIVLTTENLAKIVKEDFNIQLVQHELCQCLYLLPYLHHSGSR